MDTGRLQAYASWAEVASAVAVVASLIYLGTEFRRSSTIDSREVDVVLYERISELNRMVVEVPGLAETILTAAVEPEVLSPADRLRYLAYQEHFFSSWEVAWYYHGDGILRDDTWTEWDGWFAGEAQRRPAFGWVENRHNFPAAEFQQHVDEIVAAAAPAMSLPTVR